MTLYDVITIGGGPAGLTASIFSARKGLKTLNISCDNPTTQLKMADVVENYPGFIRISGTRLMKRLEKQCEEGGIRRIADRAERIRNGAVKIVETCRGKMLRTKTVIYATGSSMRMNILDREGEYRGHGVYYCSRVPEGSLKGKSVCVLGGGNSAVSSAVRFSKFAESVTIITNAGSLSADPAEMSKMKGLKNVRALCGKSPLGLSGGKKMDSLKIKDTKTGKEETLNADCVCVNIGTTPENSVAIESGLMTDENGYIITDKSQSTSLKGVFAAGDICGGLRVIAKAAGEGATAADSAGRFLSST